MKNVRVVLFFLRFGIVFLILSLKIFGSLRGGGMYAWIMVALIVTALSYFVVKDKL